MELYRFKALGKDGKMYTNFIVAWKYKGKTYKVYCKPSFFKDWNMFFAHSTKVNEYKDIK